jgi:hypothetical protein
MAQFRVYRSTDSGAPTLNGISGSLLSVLDACLVNGYGTQPGAGWLKPIANTGSYGCWQLPSGSTGHFLFMEDAASGSAAGAEARITGWASITSFDGEAVTGSNQFPTRAQVAISRGALVVRKSSVATATARNWIMMADSRSLYGFILTNDTVGLYCSFMFGEFYSFKTSDSSRTMIVGRTTISSSTTSNENMDRISNTIQTATPGHYCVSVVGGGGGSAAISIVGDGPKSAGGTVLNGVVPYMNGSDGGVYVSPIWVCDPSPYHIRGKMRGFYHFLHAISNVTDGQEFTGSADSSYSGSTFLVIKNTGQSGVYFMETSDTLETN